jgi:YD repeat-containing protein
MPCLRFAVVLLIAAFQASSHVSARQYSTDEANGWNGYPSLGWSTYWNTPSYPGKPDVKARDLVYRTGNNGPGWSGTESYLYTDNEDELYQLLFAHYPVTLPPDVLGGVWTYSDPRNLQKGPWVKRMGASARRGFSYDVTQTYVDRYGRSTVYTYHQTTNLDQGWFCKKCWGFKEDSNFDFTTGGTLTCAYKAIAWCPDEPRACYENPVDVGVGAKLQSEIDISRTAANDLEWGRFYSTWGLQDEHLDRAVGKFWRHTYQRYLRFQGPPTAPLAVLHYDVQPPLRGYTAIGGIWTAGSANADHLRATTDAGGTVIGWTLVRAADDSVESYDLKGRLQSIADRSGRSRNLTHDTNGRLTRVTSNFGRTLTIAHDSSNRISSVSDPSGNSWVYQYGTGSQLSAVNYPGNKTKQYIYNEPTNTGGTNLPYALTGIVDENTSRFATYKYDSAGKVISEDHAGIANQSTIAYSLGSSATIKDALGTSRTVSLRLAAGALQPSATSSPGLTCGGAMAQTQTFDANGNVSSRTDFNNVRVCYAYDLSRNLETARVEGVLSTELCSGVLSVLPGRDDVRKVSTQWHALWRLPTKIAEPNRITTNAYNGDGGVYCAPTSATVNGNPIGMLCKKTVQATTDASGQQGFAATLTGTPRVWQYTYDSYGQVLTATDPNNKATTTTYYAATHPDLGKRGNVATITNPLGHVTTITAYDLNGRPVSVTDANGVVTTFTYHPRGWLTSRTVGASDPNITPETTTYDYDGVGQLTKVTLPNGSYVQYTYDGAHRLTQVQDGLGNKIVYTLDALGNRVKEEAFDPTGTLARVRQQVFDSLNRLHQSVGAQ